MTQFAVQEILGSTSSKKYIKLIYIAILKVLFHMTSEVYVLLLMKTMAANKLFKFKRVA